jgi:hypothetical protein
MNCKVRRFLTNYVSFITKVSQSWMTRVSSEWIGSAADRCVCMVVIIIFYSMEWTWHKEEIRGGRIFTQSSLWMTVVHVYDYILLTCKYDFAIIEWKKYKCKCNVIIFIMHASYWLIVEACVCVCVCVKLNVFMMCGCCTWCKCLNEWEEKFYYFMPCWFLKAILFQYLCNQPVPYLVSTLPNWNWTLFCTVFSPHWTQIRFGCRFILLPSFTLAAFMLSVRCRAGFL